MAADVKGITIALGADASEITDALKQTNAALSKTARQLKDVDKGLKFNPNNVALLTQKAGLLEDRIKDTKSEIKTMKDALAAMDAKGIDKTSAEYQKLEREIVMSESKLKHFNAELLKTRAAASSVGQLGAKFTALGEKATAMGQSLRGVSRAAAAVSVAVGALAVKSGKWADSLNTTAKVYGVNTKNLQKFAGAAELVDVETTTLLGSMQKMKKTMASASNGTGAAAEAYDKLGVKVAGNNGHLRDSNKVFTETIAALGKMSNETERDALAMQIFGKSAAKLNPLIEDGGKTYAAFTAALESHGVEYVDQATLDKANKFNDTIDRTKAIMQQSLMVAGTKLAASLLPVFEKLSDKAMSLAGAISRANPKILKLAGALGGVVGVASPVLLLFGGLSKAVGSSLSQIALLAQKVPGVTKAFSALRVFLAANPFIAAATAIGALGLAAVKSGADISKLAETVANKVVTMADKFAELAPKIAQKIANNLPKIVEAGAKIVVGLVTGLAKATPKLVAKAPQIVKALAVGIIKSVPALLSAGRDLIKGLWQGASAMVQWVVEKFKGLGLRILKAIKHALGIHSPSKEFAKVGRFSVEGLAQGLVDNIGIIDRAMARVNNAMNPAANLASYEPMLATAPGSATAQNMPQQLADVLANEMATISALNNQGNGRNTTVHNIIELGGAKVAEQIFTLNKRGQMILQG